MTSKFIMSSLLFLVLLSMSAGSISAQQFTVDHPPAFQDFIVKSPHYSNTKSISLQLNSKEARLYKTIIRLQAKEPANFSGHFRVAFWGCGTDCRNFAIIDKKTGYVYTMPNVISIDGVMGNSDKRLDFRPDSRLFIVSGAFNEDEQSGKYFYTWNGKYLKRIFSLPLEIEKIEMNNEKK